MRIAVVSLFPEMFAAVSNPRDFATDRHGTVDDRPYGGGPGMLMKVDTLEAALADARSRLGEPGANGRRVIYLSPQGRRLDQALVEELSQLDQLLMVAGRYEGIDERVIEAEVDEEVSIGDYVLSGGELAAMVLLDAVIRQLPGALGHELSAQQDSFAEGLLDCPHYTRPEEYRGRRVPEVLLSGNHEVIRRWRLKQALARTLARRPDLLEARRLSPEEEELLAELRSESEGGEKG